jgi:CBS domain-containing protein
MNAQRIGSLVVTDAASGKPLGIFTERDVLTRVVAEQRDPATTDIRDVMTSAMITCEPCDTVDHVRKVMTERRIRHVPVVEGDTLLGLVSIGDLNALEHDILEETVHMMELYLQKG